METAAEGHLASIANEDALGCRRLNGVRAPSRSAEVRYFTRRIRRQTSAFVVSSVALSARRQQCLNFLPLPQGQGPLRPGFMALEIYGEIDDPSGSLGQADVESESEEDPSTLEAGLSGPRAKP
jgi:hypothetical protein